MELRSELTALLPELRGAGATDSAALFDSVARLLTHLAGAGAPVVVFLDDVHWFDEASAALFHYVVRAVVDSRVFFAGAARPGELSDNPAALRMMRGLSREGRSTSLELGPLGPAAIAALARRLSPGVDADRVVRESEGNPLLALELSRALETGNPAGLDSMGGLIAERLSRLDVGASDLLSWARRLARASSSRRSSASPASSPSISWLGWASSNATDSYERPPTGGASTSHTTCYERVPTKN